MMVDSHCHLDFPELAEILDEVLANMRQGGVSHALCVGVTLENFPRIRQLVERQEQLYASVGVHPDHELDAEPTQAMLVQLAQHPRVVAIGETGLDYFRLKGDLEWQRARFRTHVRAARESRKPLIVHCREAAQDTLRILAEEGASEAGGVMHCFTESLEVAQAAMEMNFLISFSGIVTFKSAISLKEVARRIPLERMLIETDAPYLAPAPYRGKLNQPAYVKYVAEEIAKLRGIPLEEVARVTTDNFCRLFLGE
ncbi:MAG: TatD family hydrolase [Nitrosomonadales bacterium]|nr:TatD family hydrolase [Nitrosomonadales bacterium]